MFLYITGVSGSGKTTLCTKLAESHADVQNIGGTDQLMAFNNLTDKPAFQLGLIHNFSTWVLPFYKHHHELDAADPSTLRLVDYHFYIFRPNGEREIPIMPWDRRNNLGIILLSLPAQIVANRRWRNADVRPDRSLSLKAIAREITIVEEHTQSVAEQLGCPFHIIHPYHVDETVAEVEKFISDSALSYAALLATGLLAA